MSGFDDFDYVAGRSIDEEFANMTLEDIQSEILTLHDLAESGEKIDEKRFDKLIKAQEEHPEYQEYIAEERMYWRESIIDFCDLCLERTRSFVPVNIFDCSQEDLVNQGLPVDLARRILQRQCLWLVRMSQEEIARLHESDLLGRFNSLQQNLDIMETAAIYYSLPDEFKHDTKERKIGWKNAVEDNLRRMLLDNDNDELPPARIRNPAYNGKQTGPFKDTTTVRQVEVVKGDTGMIQRRSFIDVCQGNSLISRMRSMPAKPASSHSTSQLFGQVVEEADNEDEDEDGEEDVEVIDENHDLMPTVQKQQQPQRDEETPATEMDNSADLEDEVGEEEE